MRFSAKPLMLLAAASLLALLYAAGLAVYLLATGKGVLWPVVFLSILLPWIAGNSVVLIGALRMADLRNYRLSWIASLLAMTPFPGPLFFYPVGLICGGISLIVLLQSPVKRAFADAALNPSAALANSSHRSMAALVKYMLLAMFVIASIATLAYATSSYWWRGSASPAWAIVALVQFVAVHAIVYITNRMERRCSVGEGETGEIAFGGGDGFVLLVVVGIAGFAGSKLHRLEDVWQCVTVAALVSIVVTFGSFYGIFKGGDGDCGDDDGD